MLTEGGTLGDFRKLTEKSEGKFCMVELSTRDGNHLRAAAVGDGSAYGLGNVVGNAAGGGQDEIFRLHRQLGQKDEEIRHLMSKYDTLKDLRKDITKHPQYEQVAEALAIQADIKKHPQYKSLEKQAADAVMQWQTTASSANAVAARCREENSVLKSDNAELRVKLEQAIAQLQARQVAPAVAREVAAVVAPAVAPLVAPVDPPAAGRGQKRTADQPLRQSTRQRMPSAKAAEAGAAAGPANAAEAGAGARPLTAEERERLAEVSD